jgi:hypothetical protein
VERRSVSLQGRKGMTSPVLEQSLAGLVINSLRFMDVRSNICLLNV